MPTLGPAWPMPGRDEQKTRREKRNAAADDVMEMATELFQERTLILRDGRGHKARALHQDRGLTPATQQSSVSAIAPDSRTRERRILRQGRAKAGHRRLWAGAAMATTIRSPTTWFRDRLMFRSRMRAARFMPRRAALAPDAMANT